MNSRSVGDKLETRIFHFFESEIAADRFFAKSECCKIFRNEGYYSKDRGKKIKFDISIEIYLPDSISYSVLVLIECKNYSHAVPVDDAEEFFAKVQQISGANVKGVIASTNAFQQGTLNYCNSKGMGVLRYFGDDDLKWVLHRSPSSIHSWSEINYSRIELNRGLTSPQYSSRHFDFYCCYDDQYTYSLNAFLLKLVIQNIPNRSVSRVRNGLVESLTPIQFISKDSIENLATSILKRVDYSNGPVSLESICKWQEAEAGLVVRTGVQPSGRDLKAGALGRIHFDLLEITIYDLPNTTEARQRFTLAHELGHHFLGHSKYMSREYCDIADLKLDSDLPFKREDLRRLDWQANYFASCLLLARTSLVRDVLSLAEERGIRDRGFGLIYVDEQECNEALYRGIASHLKVRYKVSALALKLRLEELGLLRDVRTKTSRFTSFFRVDTPSEDNPRNPYYGR